MSGVLADTGHGLVIMELHAIDAKWRVYGDVLDSSPDPTIGFWNPIMPFPLRFDLLYVMEAKLSEFLAVVEVIG